MCARLFGLAVDGAEEGRFLVFVDAGGLDVLAQPVLHGSRGQALRLTFRKDELDSGQYSQGRFRMARPLRIEH